ncbi:MAG: hypothetical protein QGM46_07990 [Actinomycetota bacterium]|nr:hypothetical protein [Actinomycetota bacterium]MDK1102769.1 hypothetical protein [Actinomycetota bacterium]MDK1292270.1 hypothetical protein [Actinomycetota bacterium]
MKGRPILGVIAGFLFGLFGGVTLFMYGAIPLHSELIWILPLVGLLLGLILAAWAPFGKAPAAPQSPTVTPPDAGEHPAP